MTDTLESLALPRVIAAPRLLPMVASLGLSGVALGGLGLWLRFNEGEGATLALTFGVIAVVVGAALCVSRRPLFAAALTIAIVAAIVVIARLKRGAEGMVFHTWDVVQALLSPGDLGAPLREYPAQWFFGALAALAAAAALAAILRVERPIAPPAYAAALVLLGGALTAFAAPRLPERGHTQFYWDGLYVSAFVRSFGETAEAIARGGLFETGGAAGPVLPGSAQCRPTRAPHILLIHEESVTPPSVFPGLAYDRSLDELFRSRDGASRRLRVETYGGASWLTEFAVLAGMSTRGFGSMAAFVQPFMSGRLAETVPQVLAKCGYRNMMFTAWPKHFMGVAGFYESIGVREIFDQKAQGNRRENERDRFFFTNALGEIDRHVAGSRAPLFLFIETMSAHWPYDVTYEPGVDVPGGASGAHPEVHEYLRRLAMVKMDDQWLRAELARRFPNEAFFIVRYGDHHPLATRTLIGLPETVEVQDIRLPADSPGFLTFYSTDGVGYAPPPTPSVDTIDAAYLGAVLLDAARLPLPPSWRERLALMRDCGGRYWTCADRPRILEFQRRLADGRLILAR